MELLQLTYFCDAAQSEKFSATARKFMVPTSNISQSVKRLEKELSVELFEHYANRVRLSDAGRRFYEKASAALALLEEAKGDVRREGECISGEIRMLVLCNRRFVTETIEAFNRVYPKVSFLLRHAPTEGDEYDIVISDRCPSDCESYGVLAEEEILLSLPKTHALAKRERLTPRDLEKERFISMPRGRSLYRMTEKICADGGFVPNVTIETDDPHYVRKYVELGLGVAFVPAFSWKGLFSPQITLKSVGSYSRKTYVCLLRRKKPKPATEALVDCLLHRSKEE